MYLLLHEVRSLGIDVELFYTGELRGATDMFRATRRLRKHCAGFDAVHAQYGSACGWITSLAMHPNILTLRGTDLLGVELGSVRRRVRGAVGQLLTYRSLRSYSSVVVVSQQMANFVESRTEHLPISVLPDGLDLNLFSPMNRQDARARLGEPDNKRPWVLAASIHSSNPIKRWPLARATFDVLSHQIAGVELRAISGVSHADMPLWINAADVVLVTSTHEGWPNIVKEGLACNVPFVSTNVSDLHRIATVEPSCQIAEANPTALADALAKTISAGRNANLRRHVESMDVGLIAQKYLAIYEEVCSLPEKVAA